MSTDLTIRTSSGARLRRIRRPAEILSVARFIRLPAGFRISAGWRILGAGE